MSRTELASHLLRYLEEYASSSSLLTAVVPFDKRGTSDSVDMAANFLQQPIYVIQRVVGQAQSWRCL